jgi:hypothetical protein
LLFFNFFVKQFLKRIKISYLNSAQVFSFTSEGTFPAEKAVLKASTFSICASHWNEHLLLQWLKRQLQQ